jgi:hypothetical protein
MKELVDGRYLQFICTHGQNAGAPSPPSSGPTAPGRRARSPGRPAPRPAGSCRSRARRPPAPPPTTAGDGSVQVGGQRDQLTLTADERCRHPDRLLNRTLLTARQGAEQVDRADRPTRAGEVVGHVRASGLGDPVRLTSNLVVPMSSGPRWGSREHGGSAESNAAWANMIVDARPTIRRCQRDASRSPSVPEDRISVIAAG